MSPRTSQRVDRRRRVLVDESRNDNEAQSATPRIFRGGADVPSGRYNSQALQSMNAPIVNYIPLRSYSLGMWLLVGFVPIMGLLALHEWRVPIAQRIGAGATRGFDLTADGNLVAWLSSVSLAFSAAVMLGIYSVRRHRRDDYRGRFTLWRWGILAAILASVDATVGLHSTLQACCQYVTQTALWGDGSVWWIGLWTLFFGGITIRLMFEMTCSRQAVVAAIAAAACYAWSGLVELGPLTVVRGGLVETSQVAALMTGHHLILFALISYARQIVLEAMGIVSSPAEKEKPEKDSTPEKVPQPQRKSSGVTGKTVAAEDDDEAGIIRTQAAASKLEDAVSSGVDDEAEGQTRRLSKAERRRMNKEKRRKAA